VLTRAGEAAKRQRGTTATSPSRSCIRDFALVPGPSHQSSVAMPTLPPQHSRCAHQRWPGDGLPPGLLGHDQVHGVVPVRCGFHRRPCPSDSQRTGGMKYGIFLIWKRCVSGIGCGLAVRRHWGQVTPEQQEAGTATGVGAGFDITVFDTAGLAGNRTAAKRGTPAGLGGQRRRIVVASKSRFTHAWMRTRCSRDSSDALAASGLKTACSSVEYGGLSTSSIGPIQHADRDHCRWRRLGPVKRVGVSSFTMRPKCKRSGVSEARRTYGRPTTSSGATS